jgi:hypothetical protein
MGDRFFTKFAEVLWPARKSQVLPPTPGGRHSFDTWLLGQRRLRNRRWAIRPFQSFDLDQKFWCRDLFGFNEQIFGADEQNLGRGQSD